MNSFKRYGLILVIFTFLLLPISATFTNQQESGLKPWMNGERNGTYFSNVTSLCGLEGVSGNFFSWGDFNNDEYQDLLAQNRLFMNLGPPSWTFIEVTQTCGITGGGHGTWGDFNNDGYSDIYMVGANILWMNNGPDQNGRCSFTDVTENSGIQDFSHTTASGWGDYDNDGFADLFIARGEDWNDGNPRYYPNVLYRNRGDGSFENVTLSAGVDESVSPTYSRGVAWCDYNMDGWLDLYISNYRQLPNYLYENQGNGTFVDVAPAKGVADGIPDYSNNPDPYDRAGHSVGSIWGDFDQDNDMDLWVTNLNHKDFRTSDDSLLYENQGAPLFEFRNVRGDKGIPVKPYIAPNQGDELFVGCAWDDMDNDGSLDLFLPQVYDEVNYAYSFLYKGGDQGTFTDITEEAGVRVWNTYASSWCDYNNDGMMDLLTAGKYPFQNGSYEIRLFRNNLENTNKWLGVNLQGTDHNTKGIGAMVSVRTTGKEFSKQVEAGMGAHGQQNPFTLHFGLGDNQGPVDLTVTWGPGKIQNLTGIELNQIVNITEPLDLPDLAVRDIIPSRISPIIGENITIQCRIMNMGAKTIEKGNFSLYLDNIDPENTIGSTIIISDLDTMDSRILEFFLNTSGIEDEHELIAEVKDIVPEDSKAENNIKSQTIDIREKNLPPVPVLNLDTYEIMIQESLDLDASDSSDDEMITHYDFDFGDGNSTGWIISPTVQHTFIYPGTFTISLNVMDGDEEAARSPVTQDIVVTAPENMKPSASIVSIEPQIARQGIDSVVFHGEGTDEDGVIVDLIWRSSLDGTLSHDEKFQLKAEELTPGKHDIYLRVKDDRESWSDESHAMVEIRPPNMMPTAFIDLIYPNPSKLGGRVEFRGHGEDRDGAVISHIWTSDMDGLLYNGTEFFTSALSSGKHNISLAVVDDMGSVSEPAVTSLTVGGPNLAPTCRILLIEPIPAYIREETYFYAEGEDADGGISQFIWTSNLDGYLGQGESLILEKGLSLGTHIISLKALDDGGLESSGDSMELEVIKRNIKPALEFLKSSDSNEDPGTVSRIADFSGLIVDDHTNPVTLQLKIGGGKWHTLDEDEVIWTMLDEDTKRWIAEIDVSELDNGAYLFQFRCSDGLHLSNIIKTQVYVERSTDNGRAEEETIIEPTVFLIILGVIVLALIIGISIILRRPKNKK